MGVERSGLALPEPREVPGPFAVIGRDPGSDLLLEDPEVGRRHAYFQVIGGRVFAVDLGSRTGLRWDDGPRHSGWVSGVEGIQVGPFRLRPQLEGEPSGSPSADDPPPTSRSFRQPGLPEVELEFLDPAVARPPWRISRALVLLGRSPACKVVFSGTKVASIHASLVLTPAGLWVVDLKGRGGTRVNGRRVRAVRLVDGDELRVGDNHLRIRGDTTATANLPAIRAGIGGDPTTLIAAEPGRVLIPTGAPFDPTLVALFGEVGRMQQQMADQFQQALVTMFRLFSGMHQDQMTLIREELARLHQLTEEQQSLQARLAEPGPEPSGGWAGLRVVTADSRPDSTPRSPSDVRRESRRDGNRVGEATSPNSESGRAVSPGGRPAASRLPGAAGDELHDQIIQRLASIQEERQGRWQKLLNSVLGRAAGGGASE